MHDIRDFTLQECARNATKIYGHSRRKCWSRHFTHARALGPFNIYIHTQLSIVRTISDHRCVHMMTGEETEQRENASRSSRVRPIAYIARHCAWFRTQAATEAVACNKSPTIEGPRRNITKSDEWHNVRKKSSAFYHLSVHYPPAISDREKIRPSRPLLHTKAKAMLKSCSDIRIKKSKKWTCNILNQKSNM